MWKFWLSPMATHGLFVSPSVNALIHATRFKTNAPRNLYVISSNKRGNSLQSSPHPYIHPTWLRSQATCQKCETSSITSSKERRTMDYRRYWHGSGHYERPKYSSPEFFGKYKVFDMRVLTEEWRTAALGMSRVSPMFGGKKIEVHFPRISSRRLSGSHSVVAMARLVNSEQNYRFVDIAGFSCQPCLERLDRLTKEIPEHNHWRWYAPVKFKGVV